jgi:hypothetical protein
MSITPQQAAKVLAEADQLYSKADVEQVLDNR